MTEFIAAFRTIPDTAAALGRAGRHTIVVDRADGRAGGMGLGFNGGELLALSIGGCLCNDVRYAAEKRGVAVENLAIDVRLTMEGDPLVATGATVSLDVRTANRADAEEIVAAALRDSAVANSVARGFPIKRA